MKGGEMVGEGGGTFPSGQKKEKDNFPFLFTIVNRLIGIHGTAAEG
jgi:hypothetical protein